MTRKNFLFLNPEIVNTAYPMQQFLPIQQQTVKEMKHLMTTKNGKDVNHEYRTKHPKEKNPPKYLILQQNHLFKQRLLHYHRK